ncbi:hypothetical protein BN168_560023 [Clostridioides difficile CD002]|nr:hypothetical protein BN167_2520001 [Clostridioides difficile E13]CCL07866.1 hypothetical protein BN168_560023 [Clostridioides difficile CD002]
MVEDSFKNVIFIVSLIFVQLTLPLGITVFKHILNINIIYLNKFFNLNIS